MNVIAQERLDHLRVLARERPLSIAHRGASAYAPENTLDAFSVAARLGADLWELDVRVSKDGVCMVCHDEAPQAIDGRSAPIAEQDRGTLQDLRLTHNGRLATLKEVLFLAKQSACGLYIELKDCLAGKGVLEVLCDGPEVPVIIGSFGVRWLAELHSIGCQWPLAVLVPLGEDPFELAVLAKADIIHLCWERCGERPQDLLTEELFEQAQVRGLEVVLWHEERADIVAELLRLPVLGICSNRPEILKPFVPSQDFPVEIVCHRGANWLAPENSLAAARICWDQGLTYVECDVRTTGDFVVVVMHDETVARTTDGCGRVADLGAHEISRLDGGSWFSSLYEREPVPTLGELLGLAGEQGRLYIEIKDGREQGVLALVEQFGMWDRTFFWSEFVDCMARIHRDCPQARLMIRQADHPDLSRALVEYSPYLVEFDVFPVDNATIELCHRAGARVMAWYPGEDLQVFELLRNQGFDLINVDHWELCKGPYSSSGTIHDRYTNR